MASFKRPNSNCFLHFTVKTGVLRFGPAPEEMSRMSNSTGVTTPTALSQSPLRATPLSSMTRLAGSTTPESTLQPSDYSTANQSNVSAIPIVGSKSQKKRKEGSGIDYESSSSNRDDVQSPAYSDISDDSTPVVDSDLMGKKRCSFFERRSDEIDGFPAHSLQIKLKVPNIQRVLKRLPTAHRRKLVHWVVTTCFHFIHNNPTYRQNIKA